MMGFQKRELFRRLDPFGDDAHPQGMRERNDGTHNGGIVRILGEVVDPAMRPSSQTPPRELCHNAPHMATKNRRNC